MSWIIYLFGSGVAFFAGASLVLAGVALAVCIQRRWSGTLATLLALLGMILVAVSGTPLPYWLYALAGVLTLIWLVAERSGREGLRRSRGWSRAAAAGVWLVMLLAEAPYQFTPTLEVMDHPVLTIFADSVSAGTGERDISTWPGLLARTHTIAVRDYSVPGATVRNALRRAEVVPPGPGIVLLEIGGNDLLGSTPVRDFERDLDALLTRVSGPGRSVLMFELPLLPFANEFGRVQRRLAAKHAVYLVPKRIFVGVLTAEGATSDSIHLTAPGQQRMAAAVWALVRPAYGGG